MIFMIFVIIALNFKLVMIPMIIECNSKILSIFPVDSKVNLFEAYTEFWARIMNVIFCSYFNTKNQNNINDLLSNAEYFMSLESAYSFFQMFKILDFMNMEYTNLYENNEDSENIRKTLYKENTSVLSYYVITLILKSLPRGGG